MLEIENLLETNFRTVKKDYSLRQLIKEIEQSTRNIFPVLDDDGNLEGLVLLDDVRKIMFKPEYYDKVFIKDIMYKLNDNEIVDVDKDNMEAVVNKFNITGHYNLPVVKNGKYLGFLSRANVFTSYRKLINLFSGE
jgi:CIC family chloride channel protein